MAVRSERWLHGWRLALFVGLLSIPTILVLVSALNPLGSGVCHCEGITSTDVTVDGSFEWVSEPTYPSCTAANDSGCFTPQSGAGGTYCTFQVNSAAASGGGPQEALLVTVERGGSGVAGASVSLGAQGIELGKGGNWNATTGSTPGLGSGEAGFPNVSGILPANDSAGGSIEVTVTLSSQGVVTTGSSAIPVAPPAGLSC